MLVVESVSIGRIALHWSILDLHCWLLLACLQAGLFFCEDEQKGAEVGNRGDVYI